jgi:hypothetical protein
MVRSVLLFVFVVAQAHASTSFKCHIDLWAFSDLKPAKADCDESHCLPFLTGTIESIDTTMPQTIIAPYVLKHVKSNSKEIFRATSESLWHDGKKAIFDTTKLIEEPGYTMKVVFPLDLDRLQAGSEFQGLFLAASGVDTFQHQFMPLACHVYLTK